MTITDCRDGKLITLSKQIDTRAKILNLIYALVFLAAGTFFLKNFLFYSPSTGATIVAVIIVTIFYIVSFRFINKACLTEKLFVNKQQLQIIRQALSAPLKQSFDVSKISNFRHLAKPKLTDHPLRGNTFDYLGFQTGQQVINDMHGDNRVAFDYEGRTVTFGDNIYSWDFEALEILLYDVTGNDFRYNDEFEKTYKQDDENQSAT